MDIKNVKIKNFKGIKIIDISTEKNMILISGENGAGKSSFCDAIMTALAGKDKSITRPIRNGESKAIIEVELDGYLVRKVFSQSKTPTLHVTPTGEMEPLRSPQAWLNQHIGNLKFDPSEFARLDDKKQRDMLMELAGLNLDDEDNTIKELENDRLLVGRELKGMSKPDDTNIGQVKIVAEKEKVIVVSLYKTIEEVNNKYREYNNAQEKIKDNEDELEILKSKIENLEKENLELEKIEKPDRDIEEDRKMLDGAEEHNKEIDDAKTTLKAYEKYNAKEAEYKTKTDELETARDTKQQLIEAAQYPIEGLSVSDDGVLYNDVPFTQINDSQKIVIGTLIALALMPKDNPIKIIFIKLGSLLDDKALSYLEKISLEQNAQFVIELVGKSKGFIIEEGEIIN